MRVKVVDFPVVKRKAPYVWVLREGREFSFPAFFMNDWVVEETMSSASSRATCAEGSVTGSPSVGEVLGNYRVNRKQARGGRHS